MLENGFYKITQEFVELIRQLGGTYKDAKDRPVFFCFEDKYTKGLYWAIPTSDRHTNRPALYRISNCFPITDKYIEGEYISKGQHLILANKTEIEVIRRKLARIIFDENKNPNKYEQHITAIKEYLSKELNEDIA